MSGKIKKSRINKNLPLSSSVVDGKTGKVIKDVDLEKYIVEEKKENKNILYPGLEGKLILVKVGTEQEQAQEPEIVSVETELRKLIDSAGIDCMLFVTHHAVDISIVG